MQSTPAFESLPSYSTHSAFRRALAVAIVLHLIALFVIDTDLVPRPSTPVVLDVVLERVAQTTAPPPADYTPADRADVPGATGSRRAGAPDQRTPIQRATTPSAEPSAEPGTEQTVHAQDRRRLNLDLTGIDAKIGAQDADLRVGRLTGATASSAPEAAYLRAWRQRVERIGNANYPGGGVEGQLRMFVVIDADGTLIEARVLTSSGVPALDAAALRIVRLSAPYPAFSVDLRRRFDRLEILRSWQFSRRGARIEH